MLLMTPRAAVASLPVTVSERSFRLAAKRSGKNYLTGRQMMVSYEDITTILKELDQWQTIRRNKARAARR